ncbi:transposase [Mycobacteroides abscessus]|uniref:Mobile element protein n=16 Tax=Mycobacteriaceae TaxID=1762 RepID=A0A0N9XKE9_MYCFO|nr:MULTISPECIES: tyrosine-type recombinase/integrase [Mycobacteriaceae]AIY48610.1 Mobile element protein [Mycobacterium sp. VKM Ac-1817D]MBX8687089.1 tyrosine-type recombinase/integrase [Mycobacterium sp. 20091114027_K0903767]MCB0927951.1 tyrosine-type recombinase/integrase [Mycobacterium sp.]CRL72325.1 transposase [Mycolicibacter nonchromogenicus]ALI29296.1 Mobile element protein [Mycolicibacterium fortuitum]
MASNEGRLTTPVGDLGAVAWQAQWAQVPAEWRRPAYQVHLPPADRVFLSRKNDLPPAATAGVYDFTPQATPARFADEIAWWVWVCYHEGLRKIEHSLLRWATQAISAAAAEYRSAHGRHPVSITDLAVNDMVRHAVVVFERRNARLPAGGTRRNIVGLIEHLHLFVSVRASAIDWWAYDTWDLRADPRIPQREHEPCHEKTVRIGAIEPAWLREGVRFWLRTCLDAELLRWSSAVDRAREMARHFGEFVIARGYTDPVLSDDPAQLRLIFTTYNEYLRSPAAAARPDKPLSATAIGDSQSQIQSFYTFMLDHAPEAAAATGDARWENLSAAHTRLWGPAFRTRRAHRTRELTWYSTGELQQMLAYLDVLAAQRGALVSVTHPDGTVSLIKGLGDPQAARIWLLQALTGRRASEILMLDHHPLEAIPGAARPTATDDPDVFVAKLRYQQTKVDGVIPTILVEQAVVNVIAEQQRWLADTHPSLTPKYLFIAVKQNLAGRRPRPYATYRASLDKLDAIHGLSDAAGNPLRFTQTHRLRHTRATELLNDGVPIHVVQRYLGHKSPEMTMRYAATLAATAEAEFLKHKKIGAHGTDIGISPSDMLDMTQLSVRTDRVLPNGVCLLPPLKTCDKGNACLSCGHFATDATHLDELKDQHAKTTALVEIRRQQYRQRTGRELTDDNVWVAQRLRELHSLQAILDRLTADQRTHQEAIAGAGTANRIPLQPVATRGAHDSALRKADPHTPA